MKSFYLTAFFLFLFLWVQSEEIYKKYEKEYKEQKVVVEVFLSQNKINVAESLVFKMAVTAPKRLIVNFPSVANLGFSHEFSSRSNRFRPTDISEIKKVENADGTITLSQSYTLEPWLSNNYSIPPILFSFFINDEGKTKENASKNDKPEVLIITEGLRIPVEALPPTERKLSDLLVQAEIKNENLMQRVRRDEDKSQQEKSVEKKREQDEKKVLEEKEFPWMWVISILVVIVLIVGALYFLKKKGISIFAKKREPAHMIAYRRIEHLLKLGYLQNNRIKEFYYELSYILREYIGNRFFLYAINQTTEEFLASLVTNNPFDKNAEQELISFNDTADTAKYSRNIPLQEQANRSLNLVKNFIDQTKIKEEEVGTK